MAAFPILKTGAAAQYPLTHGARFVTQTVRFLDGSQQKYRIAKAGIQRWIVRMDLLDEAELASVIAFVEATGSSTFTYTDPATGTTLAKCVLSGGQFEAAMIGEMRGHTTLSIEEAP